MQEAIWGCEACYYCLWRNTDLSIQGGSIDVTPINHYRRGSANLEVYSNCIILLTDDEKAKPEKKEDINPPLPEPKEDSPLPPLPSDRSTPQPEENSSSVDIPPNLAPQQRALFLRIQAQQRGNNQVGDQPMEKEIGGSGMFIPSHLYC